MIVDVHAHLGYDFVFEEDFTADELCDSQRENGIDLTLVQPGTVHSLADAQRQHDAIAALAAENPGRFRGMANPSPYLPTADYERELRRCIEELHFLGVKLNPFAHAVNPLSRAAGRVFALAAESGIPAMVHTGSGIPWAAPSLLEPIAARHEAMPLIVAHAGSMVLAGEAGLLARRHANVYLECSWLGGFVVKGWAETLGADRLMFGSDHADNAATELTKFRTCGLSAGQLDWALGRTAVEAFKLK